MTITSSEPPAIACTLAASDRKDRLRWIAELNRTALRERRRDDLRLELSYDLDAAERVREMVRRERECCAFLRFDLTEERTRIRVTIEAPDVARDAAEALFEPFQSARPMVAACGCTTGVQRGADRPPPADGGQTVGVGAAAAGAATLALACTACCVLPFAFPAVALTSFGSLIPFLALSHVWATYVAVVIVGLGWIWVWRRSATSKTRPAPATLLSMAAATIILAVALNWRFIEPTVLRLLRS